MAEESGSPAEGPGNALVPGRWIKAQNGDYGSFEYDWTQCPHDGLIFGTAFSPMGALQLPIMGLDNMGSKVSLPQTAGASRLSYSYAGTTSTHLLLITGNGTTTLTTLAEYQTVTSATAGSDWCAYVVQNTPDWQNPTSKLVDPSGTQFNGPANSDNVRGLTKISPELTVEGRESTVVWQGLEQGEASLQIGSRSAEASDGFGWVASQRESGDRLGGRLNARGEGIKNDTIWRNGSWRFLGDLLPTAHGYTNIHAIDTNDNGIILATATKDGATKTILLLPVEVAPEVLAVNSDFDEGRIDPATGYAIPDCDDIPGVDPKTGAGNTLMSLEAVRPHLDGTYAQNQRVTNNLHKGWFGVNPKTLGDDFWDGANVTIRKIDKIDDDTGHPESGQVRFYAKWGEGPSQYRGIPAYDPANLAPANLVTGGINGVPSESVYGSNSIIPENAEFYMEGIRSGKITLEWRLQKGTMDVKHEQTFKVETRKTRDEWQEEVVYQIRLQTKVGTGTAVDLRTYNPNLGFYGDLGNQTPKVRAIYYYYRQLFQQMPEKFMWAGMAKVAAAPIYAGMSDLTEWYHASEITPGTGFGTRDPGTRSFINSLLLSGQKRIFEDMAWAHRAYMASGIGAIRHAVANQGVAITSLAAWNNIAQGILNGDQSKINLGNRDLLEREQRDVVQQDYNSITTLKLRQPPAFLTWWVNGVTVPTDFNGLAQANEWLSANSNKNPLNKTSPHSPAFRTTVPGGLLDSYNNRWAWTSNPTNGMLEMWAGTSTAGPNLSAATRMSHNNQTMKQAATIYTNSNSSMLPDD